MSISSYIHLHVQVWQSVIDSYTFFQKEPQPYRKPNIFCTFATALQKANYIFLVGVLCSDTLAPLFDEA